MKNIWKFMIVALMAIAMVGCPLPKNDDDDDNGGKKGDTKGVYAYTDKISNISGSWGGSSAAPSFSIIFMDETAIECMKNGTVTDLKEMPAGSPVYQIQAKGNASFLTAISGTWNTAYTGMCAKVDAENDNYTLFLDTTKVVKTELKGIGKDFEGGEKVLEDSDDCDLAGFIPVMLAVTDRTDDAYIADLWNARLVKMGKSNAIYPTDAKDAPAKVAVNKVTVTLKNDTTDDAVWDITGVEYYAGVKIPFNFYANGSASTNEVVAEGANLTLTISGGDLQASWEDEQKPTDGWTFTISKKIKIGADEGWIGFDGLTGSYDWTGRK